MGRHHETSQPNPQRTAELQPIHRAAGRLMYEIHKNQGEMPTPEARARILRPLTLKQREQLEQGEDYFLK